MRARTQTKELSRTKVREILFRHKTSVREVASELDPPVSTQAIYLWLNDKSNSGRIAKAVQAKAAQLLDIERKLNAA